jgi:transposase
MFDGSGNIVWPDDRSRTITISYDEKPGIQAIANVAEDRPPTGKHGFTARDSEYKRLGTISLLAGIDLLTGEIIPRISDSHKSADFIAFLKVLNDKYDAGDKIRIIMDNHSIHTSKETRAYLETVPERFEFVFTPKHGSWLNLIESFFGKLARVCLRGIRVKTKKELVERIYRYIAEVNEDPVVYHWTYKMDEVNAG